MNFNFNDETQIKNCFAFDLTRRDEGGVAFIGCETIPDLFIAATSAEQIRSAIDLCLKNAFTDENRHVQVFTNGKLDGPIIRTLVRIS